MFGNFEVTTPSWLLPAYIANILILVPVCWSLTSGSGIANVFEGKVAPSQGLEMLVASLYLAILFASIAGLLSPAYFSPLLLIQIIYKSFWLLLYCLPLVLRGDPVPVGISLAFLAIVVCYPVFYFLAHRQLPSPSWTIVDMIETTWVVTVPANLR